MDSSSLHHQRVVSRRIWSTTVNTVLSAMESILLDEDLQSLWPREHRSQDLKKKIYTPSTPTLPSSHDPTFSPPLKRKHDPVVLPERGTKSQRMTDHLTAQLATRLHVSQADQEPTMNTNQDSRRDSTPPIEFQLTLPNRQKLQRRQDKQDDDMMENDRSTPPSDHGSALHQVSMDSVTPPPSVSATTTTTGGRKYRTPTRNRSGPSTPVGSHPSSPSPFFTHFSGRTQQGSHHQESTSSSAGLSRTPFDNSPAPPFAFATTGDSNDAPDAFDHSLAWSSTHPQQHQHHHHQPQQLPGPPQGLGIVPDTGHPLFWRGSRLGSIIQSTSNSTSSLPSSSSSSSSCSSTLHQHPLAMATRLALFHRVLEASTSETGRTLDMNAWITRQATRRNFPDRAIFERAVMVKVQALDQHLAQLHDLFAQKRSRAVADEMQGHWGGGSASAHVAWTQDFDRHHHHRSTSNSLNNNSTTGSGSSSSSASGSSGNNGDNSSNGTELSYTAIQSTTDTILELAHWLCGPDFEMDLGRLCPSWRQHASSLEQVVHYVQVVESMRETVSGQFHHPVDLAEDLAHCQDVIGYQRTLFGEILRNKGLGWRALGLPAMEPLIEMTQLWILHLAKVVTAKIQAEVHLAIHYYQQQLEEVSNQKDGGGGGGSSDHDGVVFDSEKYPEMETKMATGSRSMADVMELVLQGALLTNSCLELAGLPCPMLVTSWLTLSTPYCWYALTSRHQYIAKMNAQQQSKATAKGSGKKKGMGGFEMAMAHELQRPSSPASTSLPTLAKAGSESFTSARMSRGSFLKTMALFENVSRLLQCLLEMREGEDMLMQENRVRQDESGRFHVSGSSNSSSNSNIGGQYNGPLDCDGLEGESTMMMPGDDTSGASSDQDDAMDGVTAFPSTLSSAPQPHLLHPHPPLRSSPFASSRRKSPLSSVAYAAQERLKATEELAAILVEAGLELCSSMAEALGQGYSPDLSAPSSPVQTSSLGAPNRLASQQAVSKSLLFRSGDASNPFAYSSPIHAGLLPPAAAVVPSPSSYGASSVTAAGGVHQQQQRNRGAVAVATLKALGGGGAMAAGSGGVGLIYVQFVIRFLTKVIEFSGVDSAQDQRLVRIHSSLQNLEATLLAS